MMPAGRYYVGDLCYVMHPQWDEFCALTIAGHSVADGEFTLKNGVRIATFCTMYGDGTYSDQFDGEYPVDAGLIGCIRVEDISDEESDLELGTIIDFEEDFEVSSENGTLYFGHIVIETGDTEDEYNEEYDEEDEENR